MKDIIEGLEKPQEELTDKKFRLLLDATICHRKLSEINDTIADNNVIIDRIQSAEWYKREK